MLTLAVLLLAALVGILGFGALRLKQASGLVNRKLDAFNSQVRDINKNLQGIQTVNNNLQNINKDLQQPPATSITGLSAYKTAP